MERSVLSDYELEEKEYVRLKSERERRALEEDALAEVKPCPNTVTMY